MYLQLSTRLGVRHASTTPGQSDEPAPDTPPPRRLSPGELLEHKKKMEKDSIEEKEKVKRWKRYDTWYNRLVALMLLCMIYYTYLYVMKYREDESWQMLILSSLPTRALSRLWGYIHHLELPENLREPLYKWWIRTFNVVEEEIPLPLKDYKNLNAFFIREMKKGCRVVDETAPLISPVDGVLQAAGEVRRGYRLSQIKGHTYDLVELIGFAPKLKHQDTKLYYMTFYLAPGGYHRFHAPADVHLTHQSHFCGELYPVAPQWAQRLPRLFYRNERVSLVGEWEHGFIALVPVGAFNVGHIHLNHDPSLKTNAANHQPYIEDELGDPMPTPPQMKLIDVHLKKGQEFGRFELGSTVVVVFEAPGMLSPGPSTLYGLMQSDPKSSSLLLAERNFPPIPPTAPLYTFDVPEGTFMKLGQSTGRFINVPESRLKRAVTAVKHTVSPPTVPTGAAASHEPEGFPSNNSWWSWLYPSYKKAATASASPPEFPPRSA